MNSQQLTRCRWRPSLVSKALEVRTQSDMIGGWYGRRRGLIKSSTSSFNGNINCYAQTDGSLALTSLYAPIPVLIMNKSPAAADEWAHFIFKALWMTSSCTYICPILRMLWPRLNRVIYFGTFKLNLSRNRLHTLITCSYEQRTFKLWTEYAVSRAIN